MLYSDVWRQGGVWRWIVAIVGAGYALESGQQPEEEAAHKEAAAALKRLEDARDGR